MKPPLTSTNQLTDYLALRAIVLADDGLAFDEHFVDMLDNAYRDTPHDKARILPRIETRRTGRGPLFRPSKPRRYPMCFRVFRNIAKELTKEDFVHLLASPNQHPLPAGNRSNLLDALDTEQTQCLASAFKNQFAAQLHSVVRPEILQELSVLINKAPFHVQSHGVLGEDDNLNFTPIVVVLQYLLTDTSLLRNIEQIATLPKGSILRLISRVYRMRPHLDTDGWHNDVNPKQRRLLAFSLQLNTDTLIGGNLLLRRSGRRRHYYTTPNLRHGDMNVFRISSDLEHKVSSLKGCANRIVYAGWFCAGNHFDYPRWVGPPLFAPESKVARWINYVLAKP